MMARNSEVEILSSPKTSLGHSRNGNVGHCNTSSSEIVVKGQRTFCLMLITGGYIACSVNEVLQGSMSNNRTPHNTVTQVSPRAVIRSNITRNQSQWLKICLFIRYLIILTLRKWLNSENILTSPLSQFYSLSVIGYSISFPVVDLVIFITSNRKLCFWGVFVFCMLFVHFVCL